MTVLTVFFWAREYSNTYDFGTRLTFQSDRRVQFANRLMPPGKPLHWWRSWGQTVSLPLLTGGETYHFEMVGPDRTAGAMFAQAEFRDAEDDLIGREEFTELAGDFTYPDTAANYQLTLVNIRQTGMTFAYGLLAPTPFFTQTRVTVTGQTGMIKAEPIASAHSGQDLILLPDRYAALSVPVTPGHVTAALFQAPTPAAIAEIKTLLSPAEPVQLRVLGPGLADWAATIRASLAPEFEFTDCEKQ